MGGYNSSFSSPQVEQALSAALLQEKSSYNITQDKKQNYASLTEAITAVSDEKYKVNGLVLTFYTGTEWVSKRYNGADASGFATEDNWVDAGAGKKEIAISESEPLPESTEDVHYQIEDIPDEEAVEYVTEAPADDNEYVRKNKGWVKSSGGGSSAEITKESVEAVLTGNIESHTHDTVYAPAEADVWDGVTVSESLLGTGTEEDPYQINSCADWIHFINNGNLYSAVKEGESSAPPVENWKRISINKNLDFNNHSIDRTDIILSLINDSTGLENKLCAYSILNGNNNKLINVNVLNGNILPTGAFMQIMNFSINGKYEYNLDTINDGINSMTDINLYLFNTLPFIQSGIEYYFLNVINKINSNITVKITSTKELQNINIDPLYINSYFVFASDGYKPILKSNINFEFDVFKPLIIAYSSCRIFTQFSGQWNANIIDTTKTINVKSDGPGVENPEESAIASTGATYIKDHSPEGFSINGSYSLKTGIESGDESNLFTPISDSELKDPSFLNILNSASGEDIWITGEDGFPTLNMQQKGAIKYDGYVKQSEFDKLKEEVQNNVEQGGGTTTDYSPYMLPKELFTLIDKSPNSSTSEQISTAIGGLDGFQAILKAAKDNRRIIFKGAIVNGISEDSFVELTSCLFTENDTNIVFLSTMVIQAGIAWVNYAFNISYEKSTKEFTLTVLVNSINPD